MSKLRFGVTDQMMEKYSDEIFFLGLNFQSRRGDPVRLRDQAEIEKQREGTGLTDTQIADKLDLTMEQVHYIRIVLEHKRFDNTNYAKLYKLGSGKRYRIEREGAD
ncbi:MAG: hypothetical protein HOE62_20530 [Alphaproteobacteria bacterium]|jgi:hypothetical protein|nr:hypothetical protein [Alphaproteobacteria bacterium]MBT4020350.1 hypothetical protein [Alphaproteobacteria bacterium]MBT5161426.1 hypothetical protein [Alphaproteobacteria bacterium]MBT7747869.1 hypothetical protein [Alphaproteobacteria bacterium]